MAEFIDKNFFNKSLFFLLLVSFSVSGQTCCSGGIPLSSNLGLSNSGKGIFQMGLSYDYNRLNTLNEGTKRLDDDSRLRFTHSVLFNMGYAITDKLSLEALLTWVDQRREITQFGNQNLDKTNGIGDGVLLVKYKFPNLFKKEIDLNLGVGVKMPFGSTNNTDERGILLNADLQPGSGAWDLISWVSMNKQFSFRPTMGGFLRIIHRSTGVNDSYLNGASSYEFGNEFQAMLGASDQFLLGDNITSPSLTLKYRKAFEDKINGFDLDNTGGEWLSLIPSFSYSFTENISLINKIEIPIYNKVVGTQLTPTYRITSGILIKIQKKRKIQIKI